MSLFFSGGMAALLLIGLPVAFTLSLLAAIGLYWFNGGVIGLSQIPIIAYKSLDDFTVSALPMYVLMSQILLYSGVGKELYEMASRWLRHLPGGLALATLSCCAIFAAISGSSVATAVTIGMVAIPEMTSRGYDKKSVLGLLAAGGTLGILIPPSVPMIIYGSVTGESVGKLFIAGVIPGILLLLFFMAYAAWKMRHIKEAPATWSERWQSTRQAIWGLMMPVLIIGGIYSGIFTPTEAAAAGVVFSFLIAGIVYRSLTMENLKKMILSTVSTNAMILFIMVGAMLFGYILTSLQIPQMLTDLATSWPVSRWVIFVLINLLLLVLGCFLETVSILVITLPILYPIIKTLGFDPIWFAIIMVVNMELALISPPVGLNLFVLKGIDPTTPISTIVRGSLPYALVMILFIALLSFFPELTTWLIGEVK